MERATSNWVWDVTPASLHTQHLAIFSLSESLFLDKKTAKKSKNELKPSRIDQVLVKYAGWCDVSQPIRGRALHFRRLRERQRPGRGLRAARFICTDTPTSREFPASEFSGRRRLAASAMQELEPATSK